MVHHIENGQITNEVLKNSKLVIIDFFATWCGPCQMLAPVLSNLDKKYSEEVEIYKVNVDEAQDSAMRYMVTSVPTLIFFKDGEEIERQIGYIEEEELAKMIEEMK